MGNYLSPLNTKLDADQVLRRAYDEPNNRLRVDAQVTATIGSVDVIIDAATGDNIAISDGTDVLNINSDGSINVNVDNISISHIDDSIKIGDGTDFLAVNSDGSINVNLVSSSSSPGLTKFYNEVFSVASGVETTLITFTAPALGFKLSRVSCGGGNVAIFKIKVNGVTFETRRTWWMGFTTDFIFENVTNAINLSSGDILTVTVLHNRPSLANYEVSLYGV
jgi:hypothetical protein